MNIFEITNDTLNRTTKFNKKLNNYFSNDFMLPLFIQENYINQVNDLKILCNISDSISESDILDKFIKKNQDYSIKPYLGIFNTVIPSFLIKKDPSSYVRLSFPLYLSKYSTIKKNKLIKKNNDKFFLVTTIMFDNLKEYDKKIYELYKKIDKKKQRKYTRILNKLSLSKISKEDEIKLNNLLIIRSNIIIYKYHFKNFDELKIAFNINNKDIKLITKYKIFFTNLYKTYNYNVLKVKKKKRRRKLNIYKNKKYKKYKKIKK